jgi:hypothetical protein
VYAPAIKKVFGSLLAVILPTASGLAQTSDWTQLTAASSPSARDAHAMTYDSVRGKIVMFGGSPGYFPANDTWEYDGVNWTQVTTATSPVGRYEHAIAYDSVRRKVVMFGGLAGFNNYFDDTWELDVATHAASAVTYGSGCGSPNLAFAPITPPLIGTTNQSVISNAPVQLAAVTIGWSKTSWLGLPLPLELTVIGMPGCYVHQSQDILGLAVAPGVAPSTLQYDLPIPADLNLLNLHVYMQAVALAPGYNGRELITSNGIDLTIGNY